MKKQLFFFIFAMIMIFLIYTAGYAKKGPEVIEGTIIKVSDDQVLVSQEEIVEFNDLDIEELVVEKDLDLIWLDMSKLKQDFELGQQIRASVKDLQQKDYPRQAEALEVKIKAQLLKFDVIKELSGDLEESIGFVKELRGFGFIKREENESIIYIGSGSKPTGGHNIVVKSVKQKDDYAEIKVREISPDPEQMVTQAITYPKTVISVFDIDNDIRVINEQGEVFEDINDETKEAEFYN